jgi:uracil-DNA glycosylase family 4
MTSDAKKTACFDALVKNVCECTVCPRMNNSGRIFGRSSGHLYAPLMFVGEAPGRLGADDTSIPFHGDRAGENFEKLIAQVGISRYDCFITNAVLCNPKDANGNNATPSRQELVNCSGFLKTQIDLVDPKIVVTLGIQALRALKLITAHSCELAKDVRKAHKWSGRVLIPLYHPGQRAMLHRSFLNQLSDYRFVAETLRRLRKGPRKARTHGTTDADVANVVQSLLEATGSISYFRLHKLFYLLEYHHVRQTGHRFTASYAVRQKDGPYFTDLHISKLKRALPELVIAGNNRTLLVSVERRADLFELGRALEYETRQFVVKVVSRYRTRTDEELKTAVYLTAPMRSILRREKYHGANLFNAPIDFLLARSDKDRRDPS